MLENEGTTNLRVNDAYCIGMGDQAGHIFVRKYRGLPETYAKQNLTSASLINLEQVLKEAFGCLLSFPEAAGCLFLFPLLLPLHCSANVVNCRTLLQ